MKKMKIFLPILIPIFISLFLVLFLTSCGNSAGERKPDDVVKLINFDSYSAKSKPEKYNTNGYDFDDYTQNENNLTGEDILEIVEQKYTREDETNEIEKDRLYEFSFAFKEKFSLLSDSSDSSTSKEESKNYTIDSVEIDGVETDFTIVDDNIVFDIKSPETESQPVNEVVINLHDDEGNTYRDVGKIKYDSKDKKYDIRIDNFMAIVNGINLKINITKNTSASGSLVLILLENNKILAERTLSEGQNDIYFENLKAGSNYDYMIIRKVNENSMNSAIFWGELMPLMPYNIVFNDISSNSIDISVSCKGSATKLSTVELFEGDKIVTGTSDNGNYVYENLKENYEYRLKVSYSYIKDGIKVEDYFYKIIKTLSKEEKLIGLKFNLKDLEKNGDMYNTTWENGSSIQIKTDTMDYDNNSFVVNIMSEEGNTSFDRWIKLDLKYDTLLTATIFNANQSGDYDRYCNIVQDNNIYVIRATSNTTKMKQTLYLKAGKYSIYSTIFHITFREISLRQIVKTSDYNTIVGNQADEYKAVKDGEVALQVNKEFTLPSISFYRYCSNNAKDDYYIPYNEGVKYYLSKDGQEKEEIRIGDLIDPKFEGNTRISYSINGVELSEYYDTYILGENEKYGFYLYDDLNQLYEKKDEICIYRNDVLDISKMYLLVCQYGDNVKLNKKHIYLRDYDYDLSIRFVQNGVEYDDINLLDTTTVSSGEIEFTYSNNILGSYNLTVPYRIIPITIDSLTITTDKTVFYGSDDNIMNHLVVEIKDNNGEVFSEKFLDLEQYYYDDIGDLEQPVSYFWYYDKECTQYASDFGQGTYYLRVFYTNIYSNVIEFQVIDIQKYSQYDGTYAMGCGNEFQGWILEGEEKRTRSGQAEGESCAADAYSIHVRGYGSDGSITNSDALQECHYVSVDMLIGTSATSKESYLTVQILDANLNVIDSQTKEVCYDKITRKVIFDFTSTTEICYVRICDMTNPKDNVGIKYIDLYYTSGN